MTFHVKQADCFHPQDGVCYLENAVQLDRVR